MGYRMPARPTFLEEALQGLAFWIGHRRAYYRGYPIPEAALVTESCNLIQTNLDREQILRPEVMYRRLADTTEKPELTELARADLSILDRNSPNPYEENAWGAVQFVIEVKRASASDALIDEDLQRLFHFKTVSRPEARAFLIVASESTLPARFVDPEKGISRLHPHEIPGTNGVYHVRRTVKAASSFERKESAHFVCICEVFAEHREKLPEV